MLYDSGMNTTKQNLPNPVMVRLPADLLRLLRDEAIDTGVPVSIIIRRVLLDAYRQALALGGTPAPDGAKATGRHGA